MFSSWGYTGLLHIGRECRCWCYFTTRNVLVIPPITLVGRQINSTFFWNTQSYSLNIYLWFSRINVFIGVGRRYQVNEIFWRNLSPLRGSTDGSWIATDPVLEIAISDAVSFVFLGVNHISLKVHAPLNPQLPFGRTKKGIFQKYSVQNYLWSSWFSVPINPVIEYLCHSVVWQDLLI